VSEIRNLPIGFDAIINPDGSMTVLLSDFFAELAELTIAEGTGSPEGILEASATKQYMDTTGLTGAILYIKQVDSVAGDKSLGWILV